MSDFSEESKVFRLSVDYPPDSSRLGVKKFAELLGKRSLRSYPPGTVVIGPNVFIHGRSIEPMPNHHPVASGGLRGMLIGAHLVTHLVNGGEAPTGFLAACVGSSIITERR